MTVHRDQLGLDINSNSYYNNNNNKKHCQGVLSQGEGRGGGGASLYKCKVENARLWLVDIVDHHSLRQDITALAQERTDAKPKSIGYII